MAVKMDAKKVEVNNVKRMKAMKAKKAIKAMKSRSGPSGTSPKVLIDSYKRQLGAKLKELEDEKNANIVSIRDLQLVILKKNERIVELESIVRLVHLDDADLVLYGLD